jgi:hypothetical protein
MVGCGCATRRSLAHACDVGEALVAAGRDRAGTGLLGLVVKLSLVGLHAGLDPIDLAAGALRVAGLPGGGTPDPPADPRLAGVARPTLATTTDPYLLVNQSTAGGVQPVKRSYVHAVFQRLGLTAHQLRVDHLLAEVHASGDDPPKLTRLFGVSDPIAIRCCAKLGPRRNGRAELPTALG